MFNFKTLFSIYQKKLIFNFKTLFTIYQKKLQILLFVLCSNRFIGQLEKVCFIVTRTAYAVFVFSWL